jgi:hypothetical protein
MMAIVPGTKMRQRSCMRKFILSVLAIAAVLAVASSTVSAKIYPWCLILQDLDDGWACAFDTFEQCLSEARAGNSGFCAANPSYQAPAAAKSSHKRPKKK